MNIKETILTMLLTLSILLVVFPSVCKSQIVLRSVLLTDPNKRILYRGIDNKIVIEGLTPSDEIVFKNSYCLIRKSMYVENEFLIEVNRSGKDTLQIRRHNKSIFQDEYIIRNLEDPQCNFRNVENDTVKKKDILANPFLVCFIPNSFLNLKFSISSFKVSCIHKNDTIALYDSKDFYRPDTTIINYPTGEGKMIISMKKSDLKFNFGDKLSEFQIDKIKNWEIEDVLYISEIHVKFPDNRIRRMNDILIRII